MELWISSWRAGMYTLNMHLFSDATNLVVLQLPLGKVWQVGNSIGLWKLTIVSWDDSTTKISVCRIKTELTNVKYVHVAMACCTLSSPFRCLQCWVTTRSSLTWLWSHIVTHGCLKSHHISENECCTKIIALSCCSYSFTSTRVHTALA